MRKLMTSGMFVVGMVSLPVSMSRARPVRPRPPTIATTPGLKRSAPFSKAECRCPLCEAFRSRRRLRTGLMAPPQPPTWIHRRKSAANNLAGIPAAHILNGLQVFAR